MLDLEHLDEPTARPWTVYRQWLDQYRTTAKRRHLRTARACLAIAREAGGRKPTPADLMALRDAVLAVIDRRAAHDGATIAPPAHGQVSSHDTPAGTSAPNP